MAAVYARDGGPDGGAWKLQVTTHGGPCAADGLSVDATSFLGGEQRNAGHSAAWERVRQGVVDLEQALRAHGRRRDIEVTGAAHLTAGFVTGFIFRRTAGWRLAVRADDCACHPQASVGSHDRVRISPDPGSLDSNFITAEVNLFGRDMDSLVEDKLASLGRPSLRLRVEHVQEREYIPCEELAAMASATARAGSGPGPRSTETGRRRSPAHRSAVPPCSAGANGIAVGAARRGTAHATARCARRTSSGCSA